MKSQKFQFGISSRKDHDLIKKYEEDRSIKTLKWFSNNYYNIIRREDGRLQFNDLRFGIFGEKAVSENDYIFHFILDEKDGKIEAHQSREQPDMEESFGSTLDKNQRFTDAKIE